MPPDPLTVAVTGPTGDIGRSLLRALDRRREVRRVIGMSRRPFDPAAMGLHKVEHRQGDVLDREAVAALVAGADVVVHLAFLIVGGRAETRRVNLQGSRNVFAAARGARRLVYASSVAAYGFHRDNPQPLTEVTRPRGSEGFYYSAQKAELERAVEDELAGSATDAYLLRPSLVAGPDALLMLRQLPQARVPGLLKRALPPVLLDPGTPFQLVHHDDVASAAVAAVLGRGEAGPYNLAGDGTVTVSDLARELGWWSFPLLPGTLDLAALGAKLPLVPAPAQWINAARVPVIMDTGRARRELRWRPAHDSAQTLAATVVAARDEGLL
jgi:UDP-glucose 4-epimerase